MIEVLISGETIISGNRADNNGGAIALLAQRSPPFFLWIMAPEQRSMIWYSHIDASVVIYKGLGGARKVLKGVPHRFTGAESNRILDGYQPFAWGRGVINSAALLWSFAFECNALGGAVIPEGRFAADVSSVFLSLSWAQVHWLVIWLVYTEGGFP